MIDLEEITVGTVQALIGLPVEGLYSIENPSTGTLTRYFEEYSIVSKAYHMRGGKDTLFREVA